VGEFLGRSQDFAGLRTGSLADVLLVEADPSDDVRNLSRIWRVYKNGELVDREALSLPQ
jgi:imidazolonepropionase-like amidohydrolase